MENENLNKKLTSFSSHLDEEYGTRGTTVRQQYEEEFEAFKLGAMIQELQKKTRLNTRTTRDKMRYD